MHFAFIPYGKIEEVEILLNDMRAQKHLYKCTKDGEQDKGVWLQSQIRVLPFGIYEYVFAREDLDIVLATLEDITPQQYDKTFNVMGIKINIIKELQKYLKLKPVPEYKKDKKYLWIKQNVRIMPVGIREDVDLIEQNGDMAGWKHEAL